MRRRERGRKEGRERGERAARGGVRSFVAVLLPEALRLAIDEAAAELRAAVPGIAWVRTENLHVTLRFLGAIDEGTLRRVREALGEAAAALGPFRLTVGGFGGFPSATAPRVIWVGVTDGAESLAALHAAVEAALDRQGIPPEGRAFHAHVTLGRAREPRGGPAIAERLAGGAAMGETRVEAVYLMRSELGPAGARYSVLAREALAGAAGYSSGVDAAGGGP